MNNIPPDHPIFDLFVDDVHVATLCEPQAEDMFWCSYRIDPIHANGDAVIHDKTTWETVNFTVKDKDGLIPNPHTFSGSYDDFCTRQSNRLWFRSLWPPRPSRFQHIISWISKKLRA